MQVEPNHIPHRDDQYHREELLSVEEAHDLSGGEQDEDPPAAPQLPVGADEGCLDDVEAAAAHQGQEPIDGEPDPGTTDDEDAPLSHIQDLRLAQQFIDAINAA